VTAQERMEQSTVSRPDREAWVDYFTERFALTLVEETITSPLERGTYVLVTEPMARERGWCVDLFKQPRYSEKLSWGHYDTRTWKYVQYDPPRLIQHQKVYRGMWIVLLDVTNTQLAAHFEETSAFTDDGLWDLLGEVLRDYDTGRFSYLWHPALPRTMLFRFEGDHQRIWNPYNRDWRALQWNDRTPNGDWEEEVDLTDLNLREPPYDRGWVAIRNQPYAELRAFVTKLEQEYP